MWSLGCTILYIFTQEFPFEGRNSAQIGTALQAGQTPAIPNSLPSDLRCMLGQCFAFRPNRRPTAAQVVTKLQVHHFSQQSCLSPCHFSQLIMRQLLMLSICTNFLPVIQPLFDIWVPAYRQCNNYSIHWFSHVFSKITREDVRCIVMHSSFTAVTTRLL